MRLNSDKGFTLPSILLISLLVITTLLAILSIIYFTNKQTSRLIEKKKLELACFSAAQMALIDSSLMFSEISNIEIDSSLDVQLSTTQFGFWREILVSAKGIIDSVKVKYLIGVKEDKKSYFHNALILSRPNLRTTIVGQTEIIGNILATTDQFFIGNIFGESAVKKDYHKGEKVIDKDIRSQIIPDSIFEKIKNSFFISKNTTDFDYLEISKSNIGHLFSEANCNISDGFNSTDDISLSNVPSHKLKVSGKVKFVENTLLEEPLEIYSNSMIEVGRNCNLSNLLVYSDGPIIIDENCTFKNVQLFSTDSISITNSKFNYPSIICLSINDSISSKQNSMIDIEDSIVNGSIILMTKTAGLSSNKTKIKINKNSKVQGLLYSENNIELLGEVFGSVFTYNFWFYKEPTEYINWLINVEIDKNKLNKWFLFPGIFEKQGKYQILGEEWIY